MEESEIVYGCLCGLILAGHSEVLSFFLLHILLSSCNVVQTR
jgi:hypothetical protein